MHFLEHSHLKLKLLRVLLVQYAIVSNYSLQLLKTVVLEYNILFPNRASHFKGQALSFQNQALNLQTTQTEGKLNSYETHHPVKVPW